jgi:DNA-binding CsgD family transcriptional regulator
MTNRKAQRSSGRFRFFVARCPTPQSTIRAHRSCAPRCKGRTCFLRQGKESTMPRLPLWLKPERQTLTNREAEVLITIAKGLSENEAALVLAISLRTLRTHRSTIYRKLGFHSMTELVNLCDSPGLGSLTNLVTLQNWRMNYLFLSPKTQRNHLR